MEKTLKRGLAAGAAIVGAALVGGAIYVLREKATPGPDYRVLATDEDFEIRSYPDIVVAETIVHGPRKQALGDGFRTLADYIFAKSRTGEELPMTDLSENRQTLLVIHPGPVIVADLIGNTTQVVQRRPDAASVGNFAIEGNTLLIISPRQHRVTQTMRDVSQKDQ